MTKIVDRDSSWIYFQADGHLTREQCAEEQIDKGYHPAGYGLYRVEHRADNTTTWTCSRSCD